jgi:lipid II:glycine glycyltransferase (peptidoglycan interpeptide bridge formation enzyme)
MADKEEDLKHFYKLTLAVRKKQGLPPAPYNFFANMWRILNRENFLFLPVIEFKGRIIAVAIMLKFNDVIHYEYSASDLNYLRLSPNQKLIWEVIKLAQRDGVRIFDFGRSYKRNKSLVEFKERWKPQKHDLLYYYYPKAKRLNTENGLSRRLLDRLNRSLPSPLLRLEGKLIYRHLG